MSAQREMRSVQLAQARALTETLGVAASKSDSDEVAGIDAASGIIALLDQAFEATQDGGEDRAVQTGDELCKESPKDKLQKAGCIVAFVADAFLAKDDPVTGETLKVACDLIYLALEDL